MGQYILSITAQDRPGIVADVSRAIYELSGNIKAASQTVHQGYFAMIVLCRLSKESSPDTIGEHIQARAETDLHVYVTEYQPTSNQPDTRGQSFIVTSVGPDQPGILHALASYLSSKKINIDDLYCCVKETDFIVICQVTIPENLDVSMLQMDLEAVGQQRGFETHLQHENIFNATNELRFGRMK
jgi:glycine cleavage system transcriptional repressor